MSASTPAVALFNGLPLVDLKVDQLKELLKDYLHVQPSKKTRKDELRNACLNALRDQEHALIKDPRLAHFYVHKEGSKPQPRKTSADKAKEDAKEPDNPVDESTGALQKLLAAKVPLQPPGRVVPRGTIPAVGKLGVGGDDNSETSSLTEPEELVDQGQERRARPPTNRPSGGEDDPPIPPPSPPHSHIFDDFDFPRTPDRRTVNVHVHFPGAQPDELEIELDDDVQSIDFGLTDDARVRKSAQLTEIIPKVIAKYTPLKNSKGILKTAGRSQDSLKYLGPIEKIVNNDFSRFSTRGANTQGLLERNGQYSLDLFVETPAGASAQPPQAQAIVPAISRPRAPLPPASSASSHPASTAGSVPAALAGAPPTGTNVDGREDFHNWLRSTMNSEFKLSLPLSKMSGDLAGQFLPRVKNLEACVRVLHDAGWHGGRAEAYTVPEHMGEFKGCRFTKESIYKLLFFSKSQLREDAKLFAKLDPTVHDELKRWYDDPDDVLLSAQFEDMTRDDIRQWRAEQLRKKDEREEAERADAEEERRRRRHEMRRVQAYEDTRSHAPRRSGQPAARTHSTVPQGVRVRERDAPGPSVHRRVDRRYEEDPRDPREHRRQHVRDRADSEDIDND